MTNVEKSAVHVVIGATGGIRTSLCDQLQAAGCRLVLGARDPEKLDPLEQHLAHSAFQARQVDLPSREGLVETPRAPARHLGPAADMVTTAFRGMFERSASLRNEALDLLRSRDRF